MTTIWKYEIDIKDKITIKIPKGAAILDIQNQEGQICMWAMVNTERKLEERIFTIYGTGNTIENTNALMYIGTFQMRKGALVFHLFENINGGNRL